MMLVLRLALTGAFIHTLYKAAANYMVLESGGLVLLMFYLLLGAIMMSVLWAPVIGQKVGEPLTAMLTEETTLPPVSHRLVRHIHTLQARRRHRLALLLCFLEGIRYPDLPHPALLALRSVRPGSWLEKWLAREVYRYHNIQNCLQAYRILTERHQETPPPHREPEVNLAILSLNRELPPAAAKVEVKRGAAPVRLERNPSIKIFEE